MSTFAQPTTPATDDPYNSAMNPDTSAQERVYFGQVAIVDVFYVTLEKGVGKRSFDASRDPIDRRNTNIKIQLACTKKDGSVYDIDQETLDWSREWTKHTLPSLKKLNADLRTLQGRYAKATRKPTGETYTNKAGDIKDRTALVFLEFFRSEDEMQAAADAFYKRGAAQEQPAPAATQPDTSDAERTFAAQALPMLWKASGETPEVFLGMIAQNPSINTFFDANSKEVQDILGPSAF